MRRRDLLGGALATASLLSLRRARAAEEKFLLVYWNAGGWDPTFVFDPHFGSDWIENDASSVAANVGGIDFADAETRPSVRAFLEAHAARTLFVNGIAVGSISHDACTSLLLTGGRDGRTADFPTRVASATGSGLALPHAILSGPRYPGDLGAAAVALSPTLTGTASGELPAGRTFDAAREARIEAFLAGEVAARTGGDALAAYDEGLGRLALLHARADRVALAADADEDARLAVGLELFASGMARSLILQGTLPDRTNWDSHQGNDFQQDLAFEHLFGRLSAILDALAATPGQGGGTLADRTVVLVLSEMGRTPVKNGGEGKDHWPYTSAMIVGAGVAGGRVIGGTDEDFTGERVDLATGEVGGDVVLTPANLAATVLAGFDVDPGDADPIEAVWE
ncbi:MAG: DUF1501 domain-containing protein [Myxococcota bacterium]